MNKLGFGLMRLPQTDLKDWAKVDWQQVCTLVDCYMEQGGAYFDTAYVYHGGMSERAVKEAVASRYPRDRFLVADKMPIFQMKSAQEYAGIFEEQLERCGLAYFDYYMLHSLNEQLYRIPFIAREGFAFLRKVKEEGRVRLIGFSYHDDASTLEKILKEHPEVDFVQLQINYIDWDNEAIQSRLCYEVAVKYGVPVIAMEPVKGGALAEIPQKAEKVLKGLRPELSTASWAIRYAASLDHVFMVLSGMSNLEQLMDNASYMKHFRPLDREEQAAIREVTQIIQDSIAIPCTTCRYCIEDCPKKIPIPQYFSLFNNQKQFGFVPLHANYYMGLAVEAGKASDCIGCKQSEEHCPQHLTIEDYLKDVAKVFEAPTA